MDDDPTLTRARRLFCAATGVLSDMDGTLVDSSGSVHRAWEAFAVRHGLESAMVHAHVQGRPSAETIPELLPEGDHAAEIARVQQAEVEDTDGVIALPGAARVLAGPRPVAVVTSAPRSLAHARLAAAGLTIPAALISFDDVRRGKPDPEGFLRGAAALGLAPGDCVVLEDAPAGISAGRAAGAIVIALRTTYADADLTGADAIVDDLAALFRDASAG